MEPDRSDESSSTEPIQVGSAASPSEPQETQGGRWVAVSTHPHREHIALENLIRQGFTSYCPMSRRQIRHARRTRDVLRPLFPGYLFVQLDLDRSLWRPILSTFGVRTLVRCGDRPSFIENGLIASLKAREVDGAIAKPEVPYKVGQQVRIGSGPFDGLVATIIAMDEKDRLVVLMDLLSQSVKVQVPATHVRAV